MKTFKIKEIEFKFEYLLKGYDRNGNHIKATETFKGPSLANCNKQFMKKNRAKLEYILNIKTTMIFYEETKKGVKK